MTAVFETNLHMFIVDSLHIGNVDIEHLYIIKFTQFIKYENKFFSI